MTYISLFWLNSRPTFGRKKLSCRTSPGVPTLSRGAGERKRASRGATWVKPVSNGVLKRATAAQPAPASPTTHLAQPNYAESAFLAALAPTGERASATRAHDDALAAVVLR